METAMYPGVLVNHFGYSFSTKDLRIKVRILQLRVKKYNNARSEERKYKRRF
jgi:hypothetical protein